MRWRTAFQIAMSSFVTALVMSSTANAGCFVGPRLVEDDSYKGYEFTNNCASGATVNWTRTYKKQDGSQGVDSDSWHVSSCSTEKKQGFPGEYRFDVQVDEGQTCVGKDEKRTDVQTSKPQNNLADRLATQRKTNASSEAAVSKQTENFERLMKNPNPVNPPKATGDLNYPQTLTAEQERQNREKSKAAEEKAQQEAYAAKALQTKLDAERTARDKREADSWICVQNRCPEYCRDYHMFIMGESSLDQSMVEARWSACGNECRPQAIGNSCFRIDPDRRGETLTGINERRNRFELQRDGFPAR